MEIIFSVHNSAVKMEWDLR